MSIYEDLRAMLSGGDRRSLGRSGEVLEFVLEQPELVGKLLELLWDIDALVRMRAADVLEKFSRDRANWLEPYKDSLLGLMAETHQQEIRWHLALILPRLSLKTLERRRTASILEGYMDDRSSIVKTFAMQGLWDLAQRDAGMRPGVVGLIQNLTRTGTPAMRARGRKLLLELES